MKKILSKINATLLIAVAAVFISLCALFVSIQEVRIMRTQQKVSVYPYLTVGNFFNGEGFGIYVRNSGTGLAKINSYQVFDGDRYFKNWQEVINFYAPEGHAIDYNIMSSSGILDQMIIPKERVDIISLPWNEETRKLTEKVASLKIKICYSSLLEDHWMIEIGGKSQELERPCQRDDEKEFLN